MSKFQFKPAVTTHEISMEQLTELVADALSVNPKNVKIKFRTIEVGYGNDVYKQDNGITVAIQNDPEDQKITD